MVDDNRLFVVFGLASLSITTLDVNAVTAQGRSKRKRETNILVVRRAHGDAVRLLLRKASTTS